MREETKARVAMARLWVGEREGEEERAVEYQTAGARDTLTDTELLLQ